MENTRRQRVPSEDEIQAAFEEWVSSNSPSGDADQVQREFELSFEYKDLFIQD